MIFWKKYQLQSYTGPWGNWYLILDTEQPAKTAYLGTEDLKEAFTWLKEHEPKAIQLTLF